MRISGIIVGVSLVMFSPAAALPAAASLSASNIDTIACNAIIKVPMDAGELAILKRAVLRNDAFTGWVELQINHDGLAREPKLRLKDVGLMGFQLDDRPVTGIHPFVSTTTLMLTLSFSHLKSGAHRLRLGMLSTPGEFGTYQDYCFSTPGRFTLTRE